MSLVNVRSQVISYLAANWATTPICWENSDFQEPDGPWIRLGIAPGDGIALSAFSTGLNQQTGVVTLDLFVPKHGGTLTAYTHLDALRALFNRKNLNGVQFGPPSVVNLGAEPDTKWHHSQVSFSWDFFETP